jgi:hypothetical protein
MHNYLLEREKFRMVRGITKKVQSIKRNTVFELPRAGHEAVFLVQSSVASTAQVI